MLFSMRVGTCTLDLLAVSPNACAGFEKTVMDRPEIHLAAGGNAAGRDSVPD